MSQQTWDLPFGYWPNVSGERNVGFVACLLPNLIWLQSDRCSLRAIACTQTVTRYSLCRIIAPHSAHR